MLIKIIIFLCLIACYVNGMRQQAVAVKGILLCGNRPAGGVKVKLWDEASIYDDGPDPDDVLDEAFTDGSGSFSLRGSTRELTTIDPVLKIYHDCDDGIMPGQRKVSWLGIVEFLLNGVLNLETIFAKEERDLL
uniref:Transthyretin-like family protein n=2 Tax=Meloidogyne TaxID=189290 RepID=A0A915P9H6_9BILA